MGISFCNFAKCILFTKYLWVFYMYLVSLYNHRYLFLRTVFSIYHVLTLPN